MRRPTVLTALVLAAAVLVGRIVAERPLPHPPQSTASGGSGPCAWQVYFSPNGGSTDAIVSALGRAKQTVLVQAYSFTSAPIAKALLDARKRGVKVNVILDDSQVTAKYSSADFFANVRIPLKIDAAHAIAHNKIMIIDGLTVITGSFNFTKAAENRNAENLLIIRDKALAARYTENWSLHEEHSGPYVRERD